jgi:hypothetical protein
MNNERLWKSKRADCLSRGDLLADRSMKRLMLLFTVVALAGCSAVAKEDASIKARNEAEEAAVKKIVVVEGAQIPGHPKFTELGRVQGVCVRAPWYDDDSSIQRIGFKHAAYDKYGDKVDAIIKVDSFFVADDQSLGIAEPGSAAGHLNCQGTAVHFEPG